MTNNEILLAWKKKHLFFEEAQERVYKAMPYVHNERLINQLLISNQHNINIYESLIEFYS